VIAIVNYGLGNVQAVANIYQSMNIPVVIASHPSTLIGATRLILPGVGAFDHAMERLEHSGLREPMEEMVMKRKIPVLGICVGMQMMAECSEEGVRPGLGWIPGEVKRFDVTTLPQRTHLPHMGWNDVQPQATSGLFRQLEESCFYFLHSYYFSPRDAESVLAATHYGVSFASSVARDNVYGVQFHPEKSHQWGIQLLLNFGDT